jgi:hypothetical protein
MQLSERISDPRDIEYITEHFVRIEPGQRRDSDPGPAYVIDGHCFVSPDYFEQERDPARFRERFIAEAVRLGIEDPERSASEAWQSFLTGVYAVCLRNVTPESIARKQALLSRIEVLTAQPKRNDPQWVTQLREAVNALDALERPFSPVYDRLRFDRPPTRDSHINDVRARFPEVAS